MCGVNYPPEIPHPCPVCGNSLDYFAEDNPDEDWIEHIATEEAKDYLAKHGGTPIIYFDPPAPQWAFVSHADLLTLGYTALEDFDVVEINGRLWELQAYLASVNAWWIEPVVIPDHG